jgi:CTP:phosphocholine cytidylyltransferase-like protein
MYWLLITENMKYWIWNYKSFLKIKLMFQQIFLLFLYFVFRVKLFWTHPNQHMYFSVNTQKCTFFI